MDRTAVTGITEADVLDGLPGPRPMSAAEVAARAARSGRTLVVLDDDPTGTQSVAGIPVLTEWAVADLRWAFAQPVPAFFVLTNTRGLTEEQAGARNREVVRNLAEAAGLDGRRFVIASRSDSTLRGHYPFETDVIAGELVRQGHPAVDGVIIVPAYLDAGRLTVSSVHYLRTADGLLPAGDSEFARDPSFGYQSSDLRDYVEEKTRGRHRAADVRAITLAGLRGGSLAAVTATLAGLEGGAPVVVDAVTEDDLRLLALAVMEAEDAGKTFLYRVGPTFVRARAGLEPRPPLSPAEVAAVGAGSDGQDGRPRSRHGLIVAGSHVGLTTRQLARLDGLDGLAELELDVSQALDPDRRAAVTERLAEAAAALLADGDVLLKTSRTVVTGMDANDSLAIAQAVSDAVVAVVRGVTSRVRPAWLVAKGGITSSEVATAGLGIRRAWARGTLLPGIVSLWEPLDSRVPGMPYVVFAGNVGADDSLAMVVARLRAGARLSQGA
jgi:uncharacterized protein YgbK (DUF1537 family)